MKKLLFILTILPLLTAYAQISDDSWKLYDDTQVGRVDITINPEYLDWLYQNVTSDSEFVASLRFRNKYIDETIDSIGFRLRGNTSRYSQKKSFKVSFNTFKHGREFHGVDKLNLNGEHNDPSIIRSKLCFDNYTKAGVHASRAAHFKVYINGKYYGLYISVEHIDDEFLSKHFADDSGNLWKCLYGADLRYLGDNQVTYKLLNNNGTPVYELKTNEESGDYSQLVRFIRVINNTPDAVFADSIEKILDLPDVIHYFAFNVLLGGWDDYRSLSNNYYLYHDPSADKFHLIPYDYDNTFGIDWFGINWSTADPYNFPKVLSGPRPLAEKILQNKQYRDLFTHFLRFYASNLFPLNFWEQRIDSLRTMITEAAYNDTFRTKDYGFTINDFLNSYTSGSYSNQHVKFGLKQFVNLRLASVIPQLNLQNSEPICYKIDFFPKSPGPEDTIFVIASAYSSTALTSVRILYSSENTGQNREYNMSFSPVPGTKKVDEADRYIGFIPPLGAGGKGSFRIAVRDALNRTLFYPRNKNINIAVTSPVSGLVINEFLADNSNSQPDPSGDHDDWLEIYNPTSSPISISGMYLSDNPANIKKWRFPLSEIFINPGGFIVVYCDEEPTEPGYHANFKLSKSGEFIALTDSSGLTILDSINFGPQLTDISFGRYPDGGAQWSQLTPSPCSFNLLTEVQERNREISEKIDLFPNPVQAKASIIVHLNEPTYGTVKIYDITGREIKQIYRGLFQKGNNSFDFYFSGVAKGVYFAEIRTDLKVYRQKFLIMK